MNWRYFMLAVCPQHSVTCSTEGRMSVVHTLPPDVHIGGLLASFKRSRDPTTKLTPPSLHASSTRRCTLFITDQFLPATYHVHANIPGAKDIPLTFPSCRTQ